MTVASRRLDDQVAAYAEQLDRQAPDLSELLDGHGSARLSTIPWRLVGGVAVVVLVLGLLLAALSGGGTAADESSGESLPLAAPPVIVDSLNPQAVTQEMFPDVGHAFAGPGGIVMADGRFHMFSTAYGNGHNEVTHLVSDDAVVWTQGAPEPILDLAAVPWGALVPAL